jgi:hypothetical protein
VHGREGYEHKERINGEKGWASHAAILNSFIALLLDDWRNALSGINVLFRLYQILPILRTVDDIKPGLRWKDMLLDKDIKQISSPFAEAVNLLFRRINITDLLEHKQADWARMELGLSSKYGWCCAVLLSSELVNLGFVRARRANSILDTWEAPSDVLPQQLSHLIVIDPGTLAAGVYNIVQQYRGQSIRLQQAIQDKQPEEKSFSFAAVRRQAIDILLSVLEAHFS